MGSGPATASRSIPTRTRRLLVLAVVPFVLATVAGLVALRPSGKPEISAAVQFPTDLVEGKVVGFDRIPCPGAEDQSQTLCERVRVRLGSGDDAGKVVSFQATEDRAILSLAVDDKIVLGHTKDAPPELAYHFVDRQRRIPLLLLGVLFAAVVIGLGRWRGLAALAGFAVSLSILALFVLPAILAGENPLAVSIVGSSAVMLVALYLAHGLNVRTTTAVLGTLTSLILTGVLALVFVEATRLSGFASEEALIVRVAASQLNLKGLLLGGIVIGSLGVLDDVTITQASAVWELHLANRSLRARDLYRAAIRIGRDHIASTVNTLVLAYAGASLPLLVLFTISSASLGNVLNGEIVAEEIVRTLVGSIGLVASVPITTGLAVLVVTRSGTSGPIYRESSSSTPRSEDEEFWGRPGRAHRSR